MKIHPVAVQLFRADRRSADGQTDMTKLIVTFRNVVNAQKMVYYIAYLLLGLTLCDANAAVRTRTLLL